MFTHMACVGCVCAAAWVAGATENLVTSLIVMEETVLELLNRSWYRKSTQIIFRSISRFKL